MSPISVELQPSATFSLHWGDLLKGFILATFNGITSSKTQCGSIQISTYLRNIFINNVIIWEHTYSV